MKRFTEVACLAALTLIASVSSAAAAVTVGQTATPNGADCSTQDRLVLQVAAGTSYVVPETGGVKAWTVKSWSTLVDGRADPGTLKMKIFRPVSGTVFSVVGVDGPRQLTANQLNTFNTAIDVKAGDILGLNPLAETGHVGCAISSVDTLTRDTAGTDLAIGESADFNSPVGGYKLNISASLDPTNDLTIDKVKKNKNKGTATLSVAVPNPGSLTLTGTGLKPVTTSADAATTVSLKVKAKGNKKNKLLNTGKVKVNPSITFTPNGGTADSENKQFKLKKN